mgnify:CR=1 FL=1
MKNKFSEDLIQKSVFNKGTEEKASTKRTSSSTPKATTQYAQMLKDMEEERTKGLNVQIPMSLYRRMRDNIGTSFQSIALTAIREWVERHCK